MNEKLLEIEIQNRTTAKYMNERGCCARFEIGVRESEDLHLMVWRVMRSD